MPVSPDQLARLLSAAQRRRKEPLTSAQAVRQLAVNTTASERAILRAVRENGLRVADRAARAIIHDARPVQIGARRLSLHQQARARDAVRATTSKASARRALQEAGLPSGDRVINRYAESRSPLTKSGGIRNFPSKSAQASSSRYALPAGPRAPGSAAYRYHGTFRDMDGVLRYVSVSSPVPWSRAEVLGAMKLATDRYPTYDADRLRGTEVHGERASAHDTLRPGQFAIYGLDRVEHSG